MIDHHKIAKYLADRPIRIAALVIVAVVGAYIMWMGYRLNETLAGPDWCAKAIQAERITPGNTFVGLVACVDLLKLQVSAIASNSHILFGVIALVLLVLVVIVIAGGRLNFKAGPEGISGDIGKEPVPVEVKNPPEAPIPVDPKP